MHDGEWGTREWAGVLSHVSKTGRHGAPGCRWLVGFPKCKDKSNHRSFPPPSTLASKRSLAGTPVKNGYGQDDTVVDEYGGRVSGLLRIGGLLRLLLC